MSESFLSQITINTIEPLHHSDIKLSKKQRQHLILTGRNGSGKTTALEAIWAALQQAPEEATQKQTIKLTFAAPEKWQEAQREAACILAYYSASYHIDMRIPEAATPLELPRYCENGDSPGKLFLQHLVNVHTEKAFALEEGNHEEVEQLESWLAMIDQALQELFQDPTLSLHFHHQGFAISLISQQYPCCNITELSDGQKRIFSIFCDLLMRMESLKAVSKEYKLPGIVLIDYIENSLHTDVQKHVLPLFEDFFPNLQFIVSTHSPFVMNSLESAVVFDLDKHAKVNDLLTYPYEALIEQYDLSRYSDQIRQFLGEYENLLNKKVKNDKEEFRLLELGNYLAWVLNKFRQEREKKKAPK
jgi:predicted ATPase